MRKCLVAFSALYAAILCAQNPPPIRSWAEAEKLETDLNSRPDDLNVHQQLLAYYTSQRTQSADRATPLRRKHILWFVEHHPEQTVLSSFTGTLEPAADPEGFAQCRTAWEKVLAAPKPLFDTIANAVFFFKTADPALARQIADDGLRRYPGNAHISEKKGLLMAYSIAGVTAVDQYGRATSFAETRGSQASRDRQDLASSDDPNLISGAARGLEQQAFTLNSQHSTARVNEIEDLVVRLYQRADEVDPNYGRWRSSLAMAYRNFSSFADSPSEKTALIEKALAIAPASSRTYVLTAAAQHYFSIGNTAKAAEAAGELLKPDQNTSNPSYGDTVFTANIILGRVALLQGDPKEAARRLLAAGHAPSTASLSSNGPTDWNLAEDLLAAGEHDSVLAYLELLRGLWKNGASRVDRWASTVRAGGIPDFPGSAEFPKDRYVGRPAPEFTLKDIKGNDVTLASFKGKVVLMDFWATWCAPCRAEMPQLQRMHNESGSDFAVVTLDVNEPLQTVAEYMEKEKFTFPVLLASGTDVMNRYGVHAYPTTFFIDKNGVVSDVIVGGGEDSGPRLQARVEAARAGAPAPAPGSRPAPAASPGGPPLPPTATAEDLYRDAVRRHGIKDYTGAIQALERALELRPNWLQALTGRADNLYHAKRYDEALAGFDQAIRLDPNRAASYDGRGLVYSYSGRHEKAIPDYTRAIELQPTFSGAYNNRGWAYLELGRLEESLVDFNKALDLNPAYTIALMNRAHLFERQKEYAKAIADFDSILHLEPANTQATSQKAADLRRLENAPAPATAPKVGGTSQPHAIHCQGRLDIPQTFNWSLDDCQMARDISEQIWFEAVDSRTRYITPKAGVLLAIVGERPPGYEGCSAASFVAGKISLETLKKGAFICAKTPQGRIAEFSYDDLYARNPANPDVLTLAITCKAWEY